MKRTAKHILAIAGIVTLFLALEACTTTTSSVNAPHGYQGSNNSDWGRSITFGVHTHGSGW